MTSKDFTIKAALFGGSFDPLHNGHIAIIEAALHTLDIDTLFVIPTYLNPFKDKALIPAKTRLQLLKKALQSYPKVQVLDTEVIQERKVPTIETVEALKLRYTFTHKPYLIIGADNIKSLPQWKAFDQLKNEVIFVVATRLGHETTHPYKTLHVQYDISSTQIRQDKTLHAIPKSIQADVAYYIKEKNEPTTTTR